MIENEHKHTNEFLHERRRQKRKKKGKRVIGQKKSVTMKAFSNGKVGEFKEAINESIIVSGK